MRVCFPRYLPICSLNEDQSVLQNAATSEVIARANRLMLVRFALFVLFRVCCPSAAASEVLDVGGDVCQRNWDAACPDGILRVVHNVFVVELVSRLAWLQR